MSSPQKVFHPQEILRKKRDGSVLSSEEIEWFVDAVVRRHMSEAQIAAFLMAVFWRGLSGEELHALTQAMRFSGETFDPQPLGTFCVDKHSTGGVGDKTSLLIAPIVAAAGIGATPRVSIPMISGRSLGHTGGTLDKLETIPGFNTQLSLEEMAVVLKQTGAALVGQTPNLVPADRILYALRDHTATVESPFLICASIMSKKLAEGLGALVLDVKTGSGAFLRRYEDARFMAELMVRTGEAAGTRTVALLTSMDEPLGRFSGNWVEVRECVDILKNEAHPLSADLVELTLALCGEMFALAGLSTDARIGAEMAGDLLSSGAAYRSWLQIVEAQGGDTRVFEDTAALHRPAASRTLKATRAGYLGSVDCTAVGWAVQRLGAGRLQPGEPVSASAGIEMRVKIGDQISEGQPLVTMFAEKENLLDQPEQMLRDALHLVEGPTAATSLVREILTRESLSAKV